MQNARLLLKLHPREHHLLSLANIILLNALPLPSLGEDVQMITVELQAIFYKAAQQNTFMLCCVSSAIQTYGEIGSQLSLENSVSKAKQFKMLKYLSLSMGAVFPHEMGGSLL